MSVAERTIPVVMTDLGPVKQVKFDLPVDGGIIVFEGRNGAGKSKLLEATDAYISGNGKASVRDGRPYGEIQIGEAKAIFGRSTKRLGELEVNHLEGRFDVSQLVDPQIDKPEAADARRIKALVQLKGKSIPPERFRELAPDDFDSLVHPEDLDGDDLVAMAEKVKRRLEAGSRTAQTSADSCLANARAHAAASEGVDLEAADDEETLRAAHTAAVATDAELRTKASHAKDVLAKAEEGRKVIAQAEARYDGLSVDDAIKAEQQANERLQERVGMTNDLLRELRELEAMLEASQAAQRELGQAHNAAVAALNASRQHFNNLADWRKSIEAAANVQEVPAGSLEASAAAVTAAQKALEQGAIVRKAKESQAKAVAERDAAQKHLDRSTRLREGAKGTDEILSEVVASSGVALRVESGRLVIDTPRKASTNYAELSHGERWRIALDIAIEAVGRGGLLVIGQEAWESLDPLNRNEIAARVQGSGVCILTAACTADEGVNPRTFAAGKDG